MDITKELYLLMDELAKSTSPESRVLILDKVESWRPEEKDISLMLDYVRKSPQNASLKRAFLEILGRIGFSKNEAGLPYIVSIASDPNSPNWEMARDILIQLGMNAISEIRNALRIYSQDCGEYNLYIQGLCQLLEDISPDISKHAIPELLALVEMGTDKNCVDEFALWPIQKIGSPNADSAIPKLVKKIAEKNRSTYIKQKYIVALKYFDPAMVKPYAENLRSITRESDELSNAIEDLLIRINNGGST